MEANEMSPPDGEPETKVPCPACESVRAECTDAEIDVELEPPCTFCGGQPFLVPIAKRQRFLRESGRPPSCACDEKLPVLELVREEPE